MELSDEQEDAISRLVSGVHHGQKLQTLGGYAGTGKTTIARELHARLGGTWAVCAYTGKAASMLKKKGLEGQTIHSLIYKPVEEYGKLRFELKSKRDVEGDGFLIDEASMVGTNHLADLQSFKRPIIAIGDHGQLPPVGEDAGLMLEPDITLETIHRNAGPIAWFAEHLRLGGWAEEFPMEDRGDDVIVATKKRIQDSNLLSADQIICAFNRTRIDLNRRLRTLKGFKDDKPQIGDRVMCLENEPVRGLHNGQQGIVQSDFDDGSILFLPDYFNKCARVTPNPEAWHREKMPRNEQRNWGVIAFDFSYAITCHKSQGDEFDKVLVFEENCDLWDHSRWCYTAASRAKTKILWAI